MPIMDFKTPFTRLLTLFIALNLVIQLNGLGAVNAADDPADSRKFSVVFRAEDLFTNVESFPQERLCLGMFSPVPVLVQPLGFVQFLSLCGSQLLRSLIRQKHRRTLIGLNNLGSLYTTMDEYEKAKAHSQQALDIIEQKLGKEHPRTAAALNKLGMLYAG